MREAIELNFQCFAVPAFLLYRMAKPLRNFAMQKIIRLPEAIKKTGLSRSTIYSLVKQGDFPKQIKLTPRTMGFLESEVDQWLSDRANARTSKGG
jgi:prophage regulatory protein